MSIRILIADDHEIVREGLRSLLEKQPDMEVIAEAENGRTTVALSRKFKPDVVIMDITMPDLNGIEATRQIVTESTGVKVLALSMHSTRKLVTEMLSAGASGYLLKHSAFEELGRALHTVMGNQIYLSPKIANIVVDDYRHCARAKTPLALSTLTNREREVLQLLAEGKSTKKIASSLHVSVSTVESHRKQIMDKLNLHSIAELTKYAISEGLTSLDT
jgi:DNA-binding NarL/FixJ family response regulator